MFFYPAGPGELPTQLTVIGQEHETFTVVVKPSDRIDADPCAQQIDDYPTPLVISHRAEDFPRLVEGIVLESLGPDQLPIKLDVVPLRISADPKFMDTPAVDPDFSGKDQLFRLTAGSHPCTRYDLLQSFHSPERSMGSQPVVKVRALRRVRNTHYRYYR